MHLEAFQAIPVIAVILVFALLRSLPGEPRSKNLTNGELMYKEDDDAR